ncbi:hypothetical protein Y032_0037g3518 [Ancylostoma ceylanicum]|uniref:Uncharacterized protein n=1 Tax=Ancylostoma ceylanicum TaxID=53326 RepID=A0A016UKJ1_9BILA|nr:hypothetical protein Y032_0037g3518 [Ancylostoma ceylanicum]
MIECNPNKKKNGRAHSLENFRKKNRQQVGWRNWQLSDRTPLTEEDEEVEPPSPGPIAQETKMEAKAVEVV